MTVVLALLMTACLAFVAGACWEHLRADGSRDLAVRLDRARHAMRVKREQVADAAGYQLGRAAENVLSAKENRW